MIKTRRSRFLLSLTFLIFFSFLFFKIVLLYINPIVDEEHYEKILAVKTSSNIATDSSKIDILSPSPSPSPSPAQSFTPSSTVSSPSPSPSCPADINNDGLVNLTDFIKTLNLYGYSCSDCRENLDKDGVINIGDAVFVLKSTNGR